GTWNGGAGTFSNPNGLNTTYTPDPSEYGTTITLTFTTDDPPGPCPEAFDQLELTINTLPIVFAGPDTKICDWDVLDLPGLGASIDENGSGVTTGSWSSSGDGNFIPNNTFPPGATTYQPGPSDLAAGFVTLTLT
ncbi:hypothetical protein RZS08_40020, partial [Arthrospira platensis SPKY1]|nr:hypothetical protein [Arthrospira platensis SPKY1]